MATGQAKMNNIPRSAPNAAESSIKKSDTELVNYIQQAFADKNSALLLAERQIQEQTRALEEVRLEAATLLAELHRTQEKLEHICLTQSATGRYALLQQARIDKLKTLLSDHWEMEIQHINRKRKATTDIICWTLKHVYIINDYIPELYIEIHLSNGVAGLLLKATSFESGTSTIKRGKLAVGDTIRIFPDSKPINQGGNAEISSLGTSDWSITKEVVRCLASLVEKSTFSHPCLKKRELEALRLGLGNLNQQLNNWPWTFRFDHIQLSDTLQTHEYQKLSLRIDNLSIGSYGWARLDYGVATVDHGAEFGQNPRLEFPESSKKVITNWYAETSDGRGPRLELRFAKPNALDRDVWSKLSDEDQLLITALVTSLPAQIAVMEKQDVHKQDWQKWKELGLLMKKILASQFVKMTHSAV